jgi:hypothetical protein
LSYFLGIKKSIRGKTISGHFLKDLFGDDGNERYIGEEYSKGILHIRIFSIFLVTKPALK